MADLLRTSRVTLLFGARDDGRFELLRRGVMPLLQRRTGDRRRTPHTSARTTGPATERRGPRGAARRKLAERVIVFDDWDGAPLAGLQVAILSSLPMGAALQTNSERLAGLLAEICGRVSGRFLIILDGLDRLWGGASSAESIHDFIEQFSEAVNLPGLPVNFLLSIDEASEPMLEPLRQRIAGFDDATLRLRRPEASSRVDKARGLVNEVRADATALTSVSEGEGASSPSMDIAPAPTPAPRTRRKRAKRVPTVPLPPMEVGGVYAYIESTLTQTAGAVQPWGDAETPGKSRSMRPVPAPGTMSKPQQSQMSPSSPSPGPKSKPQTPSKAATQYLREAAAPVEPPNPIDKWLDAATAWFRRLFRSR